MPEDALIPLRPDLAATRAQRARMHRASARLRALLSEVVDDAAAAASPAIAEAVGDIEDRWERHVRSTEAPDGLLAQIVVDCPRLAPAVERLRGEHGTMNARLAAVRARLGPTGQVREATGLRDDLRALLAAIDHHRKGGSDLIYQAYNVDIGLGE